MSDEDRKPWSRFNESVANKVLGFDQDQIVSEAEILLQMAAKDD